MRLRPRPFLSAAGVLGLAACSSGPVTPDLVENPGVWEFLEPMPLAVRSAGVATDGRRVYVVAGSTGEGRSTAFQILDLASSSWTAGPELPLATDWGSAMWAGGHLHFVGGVTDGSGASTQHFVYDPGDDAWTTGPSLPTEIAGSAGLTDGASLYMFAGNSGQGGSSAYTDGTWSYALGAGSWAAMADVPEARINWAGAYHMGAFYLAGGQTNGINTSNDLFVYDPLADSWLSPAPMPLAREAHAAVSVAGKLCVLGGRLAASGNFNEPYDDVSCYDSGSDSWEAGPALPLARQELAAVSIGDLVIALGGADAEGDPTPTVMAILFD